MHHAIRKKERLRDQIYFLWLLLAILYGLVLRSSHCQMVDSPLAFVRGCHNFGIDWNSFMAPVGLVVGLTLPLAIVYFLLRLPQILLRLLVKTWKAR